MGAAMAFGFHELIAHAARTRDLVGGHDHRIRHGVQRESCRGRIDLHLGASRDRDDRRRRAVRRRFMRFGDRVRMEARDAAGAYPFGEIDQEVVAR